MSDANRALPLSPAGLPQGGESAAPPLTLDDLPDDPLRLVLCKVLGHEDPDEDLDVLFEDESGLGAQRRELLGTLDQVRKRT
jgi:hypothetical protein